MNESSSRKRWQRCARVRVRVCVGGGGRGVSADLSPQMPTRGALSNILLTSGSVQNTDRSVLLKLYHTF